MNKDIANEMLDAMCALFMECQILKYSELNPVCRKMDNLLRIDHISKNVLRYTIVFLLAKLVDTRGIVERLTMNTFSNRNENTSKLRLGSSNNADSSAKTQSDKKDDQQEKKDEDKKEEDKKPKKPGLKEGYKMFTTTLIDKIKNNEIGDGDVYNGFKVKIVTKELGPCKTCGHTLVQSGLVDYYCQIDTAPRAYTLVVTKDPIGKCNNEECDSYLDLQRKPVDESHRSIFTLNSIVEFIMDKYLLALPLYREKHQKLPVTYETILNNVNRVGMKFKPLAQAIEDSMFEKKELPILHIDETFINLTKAPAKNDGTERSNSYVYIMVDKRGIRFKATISRGADWFKEKMKDLKHLLYVISDAYNGYDFLSPEFHQLCLCHVRRLIFYIVLAIPEGVDVKKTASYDILQSLDSIFKFEREISNRCAKEKKAKRNSIEYKGVINDLKVKLKNYRKTSIKGTKLRQAIEYTLNNWNKLWTYTKDGNLDCHNTKAELGARTLNMIRTSSMVFNNENSAQIGCDLLTIVQSAEINNIDTRQYLKYVIENIDNVEDIKELLPWNYIPR